MLHPSIVVCQTLSSHLLERLETYFDVHYFPQEKDRQSEHYRLAAASAQGLVASGGFTLGSQQLALFPKLVAVSTISVGFDSYDVDVLSAAGIVLCHTPGVLDETVADTVFALMLSSARRVVELADWVKTGQWQGKLPASLFGLDVHHKTLGIVGLGRIGMAVARRAHHGFGMSILYAGRHANPEAEQQFAAQQVALAELMQRSDFVVLLVPLTEQTYHLIDYPLLSQMQPSAILINAARGDVVNEQALIDVLQQGMIAGAGLDVFHQEPLPKNSPLLQLPQVVAVPHIGSATEQTRQAMATLAVDNLIAALHERRLQNCVNPSAIA
ncbi:D-glycerate dehydrogenase [Celerinatantimonas sp. YJH-8]